MSYFRPLSQTKYIDDANLVTYWKLDDNSNDSKGSNNGTDTTVSYVAGKFGNAASYSGGTSFTTFGTKLSTLWDSAYTISMWVNPTALDTTNGNLLLWPGDRNQQHLIDNSNKLAITTYDGTANGVVGNTSLANGSWYHVVFQRTSGTTGKVYLNGKDDTSATAAMRNPAGTLTQAFRLASREDNTNANLNGIIDDVAIFSRALSSIEIADLYQSMSLGEYLGAGSATTKLLLHLDGNSADSSGNGNNGTDTSMTYGLAYGKFGQGAQFATGRKIQTATSTALDCNNITVSGWVYFTGTNANQCRIAERDSGSGTTRLWILTSAASKTSLEFTCWNAAGSLAGATGTAELSQNTWHLVTATFDSSYVRIYVDGNPYGTNAALTGNLRGGSQAMVVGNDYSGVNRYMVGNIDELIIESRAWSASEIKKYYAYAKGRFGII